MNIISVNTKQNIPGPKYPINLTRSDTLMNAKAEIKNSVAATAKYANIK